MKNKILFVLDNPQRPPLKDMGTYGSVFDNSRHVNFYFSDDKYSSVW